MRLFTDIFVDEIYPLVYRFSYFKVKKLSFVKKNPKFTKDLREIRFSGSFDL